MAVKDGVAFDSSSAQALQRYGVSATFATTSLPKPRCSMAAIAYTSDERKEWEMSVNKVGGTGASIIEKTIHIFRELDGSDDCSQEMGIQTKKIPDSAFTATSIWHNYASHSPYRARLQQNSYPGWCARKNSPVSDYLQVDLGSVKILTGLAIQAHPLFHGHHYVTKFIIDYSIDGLTWLSYKEISSSSTKVFDGIQRMEVIETRFNWFHRINVRYFKIIPSARVTDISKTTCLRIELYGCSPQTPIIQEVNSKNTNHELLGIYSNSFTIYYTVPVQSKPIFEISTAADNTSLHNSIDQVHIREVTSSTTYDNGTVQLNHGVVNIQTNKSTKIDSCATVEFNTAEPNYYTFGIDYTYQVSCLFFNHIIKIFDLFRPNSEN